MTRNFSTLNRKSTLVLALTLGLSSLQAARDLPEGPTPRAEVPCGGTPKRFDSGQVEQCTLAREYRHGEVMLPAGSQITFQKTGELAEAILSAPTLVSNQLLPAKATLFFDPAGRMRHFWLQEEATIQGHRLRGMGRFYTGYLGHMLHANGKLRAVWLAEEETIDGLPCASTLPVLRGAWTAVKLGAQAMAWFYEDGRLRQAMLGQDITYQGQALKKGTVVSLRRDGTLDAAAKKLDWAGWSTFQED